MSTVSSNLSVGGLDVLVTYKPIKNLHIAVYPPSGRVRVAAPTSLDEERVRLAVVQRLPWIRRQRKQMQDAVRESEREMVTGESHYVWGVRCRLKVVERPGRAHVEVDGDRLLLYVPPATSAEQRKKVLNDWHRAQLRTEVAALVAQWAPVVGQEVRAWSLRRMKTKWGSCNREAARLVFNTELAKKDRKCLEYVVVHELAHLIERRHGEAFTTLMDRFLPLWRARRDELNEAPLAHESWAY